MTEVLQFHSMSSFTNCLSIRRRVISDMLLQLKYLQQIKRQIFILGNLKYLLMFPWYFSAGSLHLWAAEIISVGTWKVSDVQLEATLLTKSPTIRQYPQYPLIFHSCGQTNLMLHILCFVASMNLTSGEDWGGISFCSRYAICLLLSSVFAFISFVSTQLTIRKTFSTH